MRFVLRVGVILALVLGGSIASADVPSPEQEACLGKEIGERCGAGVCAETTCSRARPGPDGTMEMHEWKCVQCVSSGTPSHAAAGGGSSPVRIAIGIAVALVVLGGGIWIAYRKGTRPAA